MAEKLEKLQKIIFDEYAKNTPKSKEVFDRACKVFPGGVYASPRLMLPYPLHSTRGQGSKIYDVDGNEYVDCCLQFGPLLLGHCHPEVMDKVKQELNRGLILPNVDLGIECAELISEIVPCAKKVRFSNSGSEAIMFAVRTARAFTGHDKVIKFYGHYHGQADQFQVGISHPSDEIVCAGVPQDSVKNTICTRYSDIGAVKRILENERDIAAIILDPGMYQGGIWPPSREYLQDLRKITKERGIVLIFDEIITGFRLALGGAQEYFGVIPDLAVFSKALGSGAKISAVVGSEEVMATLAPRGIGLTTSEAQKRLAIMTGTFVDGTVGFAAAIATLKVLKKLNAQNGYQKLSKLSEKLKSGIEKAFKERGLPCHVNMCGPYLALFLTDQTPSFEAYCKLDPSILKLFTLSLITQGVLPFPKGSFLLSFAHNEKDIERVLDAVSISLDKYRFREFI